ncbi:MAG: hypothetical protein AAF226_17945, partial [Verrucomicrobiota bacterium]
NHLSGWLQEAYVSVILAESRWKLRRAVRVMNQVLASLRLEQHPEKTFIGRVTHGFDYLGIEFSAAGGMSPSAVSEARRKEKTARLYEQGACRERIETYRQNWQRYLRGIMGNDPPVTKTTEATEAKSPHGSPSNAPPGTSAVSSFHERLSSTRRSSWEYNKINNNHENDTKQNKKLPCGHRRSRVCR